MSINTTIGGATANSYVSVASANEYLNSRQDADAWQSIANATSATTTVKENLLKQATRELDNTFRFFSTKYNHGLRGQDDYQALEFPRVDDVDSSADPFIQDEVKYATYEQALYIAEGRRGRKTETEDDFTVFGKGIFSIEGYNYLKPFITRTIKMKGHYPPFRSRF